MQRGRTGMTWGGSWASGEELRQPRACCRARVGTSHVPPTPHLLRHIPPSTAGQPLAKAQVAARTRWCQRRACVCLPCSSPPANPERPKSQRSKRRRDRAPETPLYQAQRQLRATRPRSWHRPASAQVACAPCPSPCVGACHRGESDGRIADAVARGGFEVAGGGFELGDVSFHSGWTFHR